MTTLYWHQSEEGETISSLLSRLRELGVKSASITAGSPLIVVENPGEAVVALTLDLIARRALRSAAYMNSPLPEDLLWVAGEWWHRLVASPELSPSLEKHGAYLRPGSKFDRPPLAIFEPVMHSRHIAGGRPVNTHKVLDEPALFYGEFADPDIGGANALYAAGIEAAAAEGIDGQVIVAGPEALGFRVDQSEEGVVAWRRKGFIAAQAVGFSLGSASELRSLFEGHGIEFDEGIHAQAAMEWQRGGIQFGIGLILKGLDDPPVVIPTGAVFQQPAMGVLQQNLAIAQGSSAMVAAGATVPIILPAYCLNPTFSAPSGPMSPTTLVSASTGGSQSEVWSRIRTRYGMQP